MHWNKESVLELRHKLGLTQMELAKLLGCRQQTVSEWELGLYAPANAYGKLLTQLRISAVGSRISASALGHGVRSGSRFSDVAPAAISKPIVENSRSAFVGNDDVNLDAEVIDNTFDPAID